MKRIRITAISRTPADVGGLVAVLIDLAVRLTKEKTGAADHRVQAKESRRG